jgi:hypothetical protein
MPASLPDRPSEGFANPWRRPPAFTLVEIVLSLSIATILLLAMQSSIMVASRAIPDGRSVASRIVAGAPPLAALSSDLFGTTSVTEMSATAITFTVPDRSGDGNPETIRYAWSGKAGDPLTRQYNGGAVANVIPALQSFALAYDKRQVQAPTTYTTSAETILSSYTGGSSSYSDQSSAWPAQYITPSFPVTPTTWSVTRVTVQAKLGSSTAGQAFVQIRPVDAGGLPTSTILDQQTLLGTALTSAYGWQQFTFNSATGLSPSQSIALVIQWGADTTACNVAYSNGGLLGGLLGGLFGGGNMEQSNGSSWSGMSGCNLNHYVYGTYTTPNPPGYNYFLKDVRCNIQLTSEASTQLNTTIRIVNEPQVNGP